MASNVGGMDRIIRVLLGVVILAWGIAAQSWWGILGILPIATAVFRVCPGYLPFGFSTAKRHEEHPAPGK